MYAGLRSTASLLAVFVVAAAVLRVLDAVPRAVTGLPRGIVRVRSLDEAGRRLNGRIAMPVYFPAELEWPPSDIMLADDLSVAVTCRERRTGRGRLIVASGPRGAGAIAAGLLPPATRLQSAETTVVPGRPLTVDRLQDATGAFWHQASWRDDGRLIIVRHRGGMDELLRIAASVR